jgi:hypothetical protein
LRSAQHLWKPIKNAVASATGMRSERFFDRSVAAERLQL